MLRRNPLVLNLGNIIRQRRVTIPFTLGELAAQSGVSPSHLGRVERGERFPSAHTLQKIAQPLCFSESELLTLAGYLSPIETRTPTSGLDPYVSAMLSQESVEMQRTAVVLLSILKSIARGLNKQ
jgi:transcriptional regulator with XRE-family HTH domain